MSGALTREGLGRADSSPHPQKQASSREIAAESQPEEIQSDTTIKSIHWREIKNGGSGEGKKTLTMLQQQQMVLADARKGILGPGTELHIDLYKKRIKTISDLVTRYNLSDDSPAYITNVFSKPVRELMTQLNTSRISISTPILDVVRAVRHRNCVIVIGWRNSDGIDIPDQHRRKVWSKEAILEAAMNAKDLSKPISRIAKDVAFLPTVGKDETADQALQTMVLTGNYQIGITNEDNTVIGIAELDGIHLAFVQSLEEEFPEQMDSLLVTRQIATDVNSGLGDSYKEDLTVRERKTLKEQAAENMEVGRVQKMAQDWCEAAWTELLIILLLLLDVGCSIYELTIPTEEVQTGIDAPLMVVTGCILFVYAYEASLRVFGYRFSLINGTRLLDTLDVLVVLASILVYIVTLAATNGDRVEVYITVARVIRFLRLVKIIKRVRRMLIANKSRFQRDGFDLSLTYVTPSCIAMSFPATGAEATFLNPIDDVIRFFMTKHPKHYLIFNLCAERGYDAALFDGMVEHIEIDDRNPPTMDQTVSFLERANFFMSEDPSNVIAIHCKTGKGRTCVIVCAWLMYCHYCDTSQEAIEYFVKQRLGLAPGRLADYEFLCASQRRYLSYAQQVIQHGGFRTNGLFLKKITLHTCPKVNREGVCCPWFTIEENGRLVFDWSSRNRMEEMRDGDGVREFPNINLLLTGDVRVVFYHHENHREELLCYLWAHTGFIEQEHLVFNKGVIDMACSDAACDTFSDQFKIELEFANIPKKTQPGSGSRPPHVSHSQSAGRQNVEGIFGTWRRLEEVSHGLQRKAAKNRGRQASVTETATVLVADNPQQRLSLVPIEDNLCCAMGPAVRHDSVQIVALKNLGEVHGHKLRKRLFKYYKGERPRSSNLLVRTAKHTVSGHKKRFQEGDFDLDLTYITPRLIAMGYPSKGVEGRFRNSEDEVYRFFQERHAGHYRIINLVQEREYDLDVFHGHVARYPFPDHFPPAMELLLPACAHIHKFLQADANNVVAVHCKAGKGRTGLIMVCYLLYGGLARTALEARKFYDSQRTHNKKGLTIVSQIRYAHYFEEQLRRMKNGVPCNVRQSTAQCLRLHRVRMHSIPHFDRDGGCDPFVVISYLDESDLSEKELFSSFTPQTTTNHIMPHHASWDSDLGTTAEQGVVVAGDIHLVLYDYEVFSKPRRMCHFWMHTNFMLKTPLDMGGREYELSHRECIQEGLPEGAWRIILDKHEIDQAAQDERQRMFDDDFKIEILFSPTDASMEGLDSPRSEMFSGAFSNSHSAGVTMRSASAGHGLTRGLSLRNIKTGIKEVKKKERKLKLSLYQEKHEYYRYLEELEVRGQEGKSFNDWLLSSNNTAVLVDVGREAKEERTARANSLGSRSTSPGTSFRHDVKKRLSQNLAEEHEVEDEEDEEEEEEEEGEEARAGRDEGGGQEDENGEQGAEGAARVRRSGEEARGAEAAGASTPAGKSGGLQTPQSEQSRGSPIMGPLGGIPGGLLGGSFKRQLLPLISDEEEAAPAAGATFGRAPSMAEMAQMDAVAAMVSLGAAQWPEDREERAEALRQAGAAGGGGVGLPGSPTHIEITIPSPSNASEGKRVGNIGAIPEHAEELLDGGFHDPPRVADHAPEAAPAALSEPVLGEGGCFYDPPPPKKSGEEA